MPLRGMYAEYINGSRVPITAISAGGVQIVAMLQRYHDAVAVLRLGSMAVA